MPDTLVVPTLSPSVLGRPTGSPALRRDLFGLSFDAVTLEQAVEQCRDALADSRPMLVGVVNAAKAVNLRSDAFLRDSLLECDLLVADGQSVVWASRILRRPLPERVAGIDLFEALLEVAAQDGRSVYLLGARQEVLETLVETIALRWPTLRIAGHRDGYFSTDETAQIATDIREAKPDMLFLGITSPTKEIFLGTYGATLGVPVMHGVGGSFDVMAGVTKRAPRSWQGAGMEWAYRLLQEPRRMWRRYLRTNSAFLLLLAKDAARQSHQSHQSRQSHQSHQSHQSREGGRRG
ncbi:MAG: WecB/TagA/CpsF family glycosyltransferase [Lapillicoccus sp.]